jgi:hypothetical protein
MTSRATISTAIVGRAQGAETIAECRASEPVTAAAGLCGAHGCDCGMTVKECREPQTLAQMEDCLRSALGPDRALPMVCFRLLWSCIHAAPSLASSVR